MKKDPYTLSLAAAVDRLFAAGVCDPRAEEIARERFRDDDALGGEIIDGIIKRLPSIRRLLTDPALYGHAVCLISERHYLGVGRTPSNRNERPATENDARRSLPLGHAVKAVGIWLSQGDNDLIYQASIRQGLASGGGAVRKGIKRTIKGHAEGRIPDDRAVHLISAAERETKLSGTEQLERVRATASRRQQRQIEPPSGRQAARLWCPAWEWPTRRRSASTGVAI